VSVPSKIASSAANVDKHSIRPSFEYVARSIASALEKVALTEPARAGATAERRLRDLTDSVKASGRYASVHAARHRRWRNLNRGAHAGQGPVPKEYDYVR
jgi:hypothetical protein